MAYLLCDKCGVITTHQGSWDTPITILCAKCSKNDKEVDKNRGSSIIPTFLGSAEEGMEIQSEDCL